MKHYLYYYHLPEKVGKSISESVKTFAQQGNRTYDLWYHGLPVWVVRKKTDTRVNRVQIDVVLAPHPIISFTPDAYEDEIIYKKGLKRVERKTAAADKVINERLDLVVHNENKIDFETITNQLKLAWEKALKLTLEYSLSWEYVSPFKP